MFRESLLIKPLSDGVFPGGYGDDGIGGDCGLGERFRRVVREG